MASKNKTRLSDRDRAWIAARKKYRLSHAQIQMARELGMNPKKLGSLANHDEQPWKLPLPQFIEERYLKRFGREQPEVVRSIEQIARLRQDKREERRARKAERRAARDEAHPLSKDVGDNDDIPF